MDRYEIINNYGKIEFEEFIKSGKVVDLLNEEGINILKESPRREERIDYILAFSSELKEIFKNDLFLDVFLKSKISYFNLNLDKLDKECIGIILNKLFEQNKSIEEIAGIFSYFNQSIKEEILKEKTLPFELVLQLFDHGRLPDKRVILENYNIDLTSIELYDLFYNAKHSVLQSTKNQNLGLSRMIPITIPDHLLTKEVSDKIWNTYDIFVIRQIINMAEYSCNAEIINSDIKKTEAEVIENGLKGNLVSPLDELYESIYTYYETEEYLRNNEESLSNQEYDNIMREAYEHRRNFRNHNFHRTNKTLYRKVEELYKEKGLSGIVEAFEQENHKMLSNYIIDYHFEENYHNIKLDVDELLNFYFRGNISIPEEFISIYQRVSNIDYLSIEEKYELHEEMKQYNMIERFYDDMAFARRIVRQTIKDYSLTSETLEEFLDEELTEQYGVSVYNVKEEPFFGIVKSGAHRLDELPTGHSFSLVGNNCVSIFGNPDSSNTYLYDADGLNPEQLVHIYPKDSFTIYRPFDAIKEATDKVQTLLTAPELISASRSYNEILILEQGYKPHEIDRDIEALKRIALYCIDKINEQDIIEAKREGVGIILVSSKSYNPDFETTERLEFKEDLWDYNYFDGTKDRDKFEARRM